MKNLPLTICMSIVLLVSIFNIFFTYNDISVVRAMHSGLGVLAGVLYFLNKRAFIGLTYLWLVAQLVIISGGVYGEGATIVYWDLTMAFDTNFSFGFFLDDLHLSIDVFSLLMLVVFSRVNRRKVSLV